MNDFELAIRKDIEEYREKWYIATYRQLAKIPLWDSDPTLPLIVSPKMLETLLKLEKEDMGDDL